MEPRTIKCESETMKEQEWRDQFRFDPIKPLLDSNNEILTYFVRRDLLGEEVESFDIVWDHPEVKKLLRKQQPNGSWKSSSKNQEKYPAVNYSLTETWRQFRFLVQQYQMTTEHPAIKDAAEFIFSCQTEEGDIRGFLANQYAAYYTGAILFLMILAGYVNDPRVSKGMDWLISVRQNDGGWLASPLMSLDLPKETTHRLSSEYSETILDFDSTRPSSHNWTGMIIRPFAIHPKYKHRPEMMNAASLLKTQFFQADKNYTSYQDAEYWTKFQFPYWWNHLVAVLDSLSHIGLSKEDPDIGKGLEWFTDNQLESGLWWLSYGKKHKTNYSTKMKNEQLWICYKICEIFKCFHHNTFST